MKLCCPHLFVGPRASDHIAKMAHVGLLTILHQHRQHERKDERENCAVKDNTIILLQDSYVGKGVSGRAYLHPIFSVYYNLYDWFESFAMQIHWMYVYQFQQGFYVHRS